MQNMHRPMQLESFFKEPKSKCASKHLQNKWVSRRYYIIEVNLYFFFFFFFRRGGKWNSANKGNNELVFLINVSFVFAYKINVSARRLDEQANGFCRAGYLSRVSETRWIIHTRRRRRTSWPTVMIRRLEARENCSSRVFCMLPEHSPAL